MSAVRVHKGCGEVHDPCPMGCGNITDDCAGGPCSECWDDVYEADGQGSDW